MASWLALTLNGREYRCTQDSLAQLTIKEARDIKRHTGMRISAWVTAMSEIENMDPDAFVGLAYLLTTRSGDVFDWSSLDDMPVFDLAACFKAVDEPDETDETDDDEQTPDETAAPVKNGRRAKPVTSVAS